MMLVAVAASVSINLLRSWRKRRDREYADRPVKKG